MKPPEDSENKKHASAGDSVHQAAMVLHHFWTELVRAGHRDGRPAGGEILHGGRDSVDGADSEFHPGWFAGDADVQLRLVHGRPERGRARR